MIRFPLNFRLVFVCLMAASVALPIAVISIAKLLLLLCGLAVLINGWRYTDKNSPLPSMFTPLAILAAILALAVSLFWTVATSADALSAWSKHGKLILIPVLVAMIRTRREALYALASLVLAHTFLLLSAWMLAIQIPVPWATSTTALSAYAVFSSQLDQPIMTAVFAGLCWHLRYLAPTRLGRHIAIALAFVALVNVIFVMQGRTGHAVAISLISLAIIWELPKKYRLITVAIPFLVLTGLLATSLKVRDRLAVVVNEVEAYAQSGKTQDYSSSGERLNFWHRSIQAIAERPVVGFGVGSWNREYLWLDAGRGPAYMTGVRNPHQEYLLWGVELGLVGVFLLIGILLAVYRDSSRMEQSISRATQSVLLALAISCMFNASLYDALIGDFFCVVLGVLLALGMRTDKPQEFLLKKFEVTT